MTDPVRPAAEHNQPVDAGSLFNSIAGQLSDLIFTTDIEGRLTYVSPATVHMAARSAEEVLGRLFGDFVDSSSAIPAAHAFAATVMEGRAIEAIPLTFTRGDGGVFVGELNAAPLMRDGVRVGAIGVIRDITDRRRSEAALRESQERYRLIADNTHEAVWVVQHERFVYVNKTCVRLGGVPESRFVGHFVSEFIEPADLLRVLAHHRRVVSGETPVATIEFRIRAAGSAARCLLVNSVHIDWNGAPATMSCASDVTEERAAARALAASEISYRNLFNTARVAIAIVDDFGRFIDVNDASAELYGYAREELVGTSSYALGAPGANDEEAIRAGVQRAFGGESQRFGFWGRKKSGEVFPTIIMIKKGTYFGKDVLITTVIDLSEIRRAEAALRESEQRYRALFDSLNDAVFVTEGGPEDHPGRYLQVNDVACRQLGYTREELLRLTPRDITTPQSYADAAEGRRLLKRDGSVLLESVHVTKDGRLVPVENNIHLLQFMGKAAALSVSRDITDRRRAEEERLEMERRLLHVQKLESLGVLAGGIAHDFNNILVAVLGYADLALAELPSSSPARGSISEIETAAHRAAELCRQMLAYSGRGRFVIEPLRLSDVVSGMVHLLKASVSKHASLDLDLASQLPTMEGDATQIRQVVMNLITNASEAIGDAGGVVSVSTGVMSCSETYLVQTSLGEGLPPGPYVYLEVSDTGCGMDAETIRRIFEPFFSTKFTGRGLGMAAVLGIVRGHKGTIEIHSAVGHGTKFRVLFPVSERGATDTAEDDDPELMDAWKGHGSVLLVDDEKSVRRVARHMLERAGFDVMEASAGVEALAIFKAYRDRIVLVLLDLTMPGMGGEATFRALRAAGAKVPVLMSSGFTQQEIAMRLGGHGLSGFVQKPYTRAALLAKVRDACRPGL
jgi:two-component system cell cycle sensor histidine kinase/response regulator CckA